MLSRPIPVVLYHKLSAQPTADDPYCTPAEVFEAHLNWLTENGFATLTLDRFERRVDGEPALGGQREVLITFDDGHRSQLDIAAPLLDSHGFTAASFVITDRIGDDETLTWDELGSLARSRIFEFATHTHTHQRWPLGASSTAQVAQELATSNSLLADHLEVPTSNLKQLAWPYGRTCDQWETAALEQGVFTQFVVQRGAVNRTGQHHRLPRLLADGMSPDRFAFWMRTLSRPVGARLTNTIFGLVRDRRQGAGYH